MNAERLAALFNRDLFATGNGMRVVEVRVGWARAEMEVGAAYMNAVGILQGGAVLTLADLAFAATCNSHGVLAVACQADITYFKAVRGGKLTATGAEVARTRHLSTCVISVVDEAGEKVALFKGVAFIKGTVLGE